MRTPFIEVGPAFSPDGRWIAYASDESRTFEVYVRPFPGPGGKWQISTGGGGYPVWSRNGRELFYETPDSRIMVVSYSASGGSFVAGKPRLWSEKRILSTGTVRNYDAAPDGKRLAVLMGRDQAGDPRATHVTLLLNYFDEMRRRVRN